MANLTIFGNSTNTASTTQLYFVNHATLFHRLKLFEIFVASDASADSAYSSFIRRISAENGTPGGTAVVPEPNDPADPAADSNAVSDPSGEPTYTADTTLLTVAGHQRSSFLWTAGPGRELIAPAADNDGLGLESQVAASAFNQVVNMRYSE